MSLDRGWQRIVCLASGPSVTEDQAATVAAAQQRGWRAIVVNSTWRLLPTADVLYAADPQWWAQYRTEIDASFHGERWTQDRKAADLHRLHYVHSVPGNGVPNEGDRIAQGRNSGHQAIGLAYRFGARRIVLVGYDMARTDGRTHWHGDHPRPLNNGNPSSWVVNFAPLAMDLAAAGVQVVNASRHTALTCFLRADLEVALQ